MYPDISAARLCFMGPRSCDGDVHVYLIDLADKSGQSIDAVLRIDTGEI
jgi:hypothetical protein